MTVQQSSMNLKLPLLPFASHSFSQNISISELAQGPRFQGRLPRTSCCRCELRREYISVCVLGTGASTEGEGEKVVGLR
jgi:hypothetical protein